MFRVSTYVAQLTLRTVLKLNVKRTKRHGEHLDEEECCKFSSTILSMSLATIGAMPGERGTVLTISPQYQNE